MKRLFLVSLGVLLSSFAHAQDPTMLPPAVQETDVDEHLGQFVPKELKFTDSHGKPVTIGDYFPGDSKPVLLVLNYYRCPQLCGLILNGVIDALKELDWTPGEQFRLVSVSFDPRELTVDASRKQEAALDALSISGQYERWPFLTGDEESIRALTHSLGFQYQYDERTDQFAHAAVIFALGPDGKISRYLYGVKFPAQDVKLSLLEASEGKTGTFLEKIWMVCYHYDPASRKYGLAILLFLRTGAILIFIAVALFLSRMWRNEQKGNA
jgi:protein SCO1/2